MELLFLDMIVVGEYHYKTISFVSLSIAYTTSICLVTVNVKIEDNIYFHIFWLHIYTCIKFRRQTYTMDWALNK